MKERTGVVVRGVGRITTGPQVEAALLAKQVDLIAVGRAMLEDSQWVVHAAATAPAQS